MNFKIGEIAIVVNWTGSGSIWNGSEVVIVGALSHRYWYDVDTFEENESSGYLVTTGDGDEWFAEPQELRRKPPNDDSRKVVRWNQCPWQPADVVLTSGQVSE